MDFAQLIQTVAIYAIPVIFAITVHEAAHGYVAHALGDDTAWKLGRVTLNPASHIDPIGTILMPALLYLASSGSFTFGYAKPVPVRFGNLRNPKRDMVWVALAGPGANLAQAFLWGIVLIFLHGTGVQEEFFAEVARAGVLVNVAMFIFNLFPIPPLDGGRILVGILPIRAAIAVSRVEPYGIFIFIGLVFAGVLGTYWMRPLMDLTYTLLDIALLPFTILLR